MGVVATRGHIIFFTFARLAGMVMGQVTSSARIIGRIQRLSCFGSGGLGFVPELMRELAKQVPSGRVPTFLRPIREIEIALALLDGGSRGDVSERLGIGERRDLALPENLYSKLDVHNRIELVEKLQAM